MDAALYVIRINGHLGAMLLSAFPAMVPEQDGPATVLTGVLDQPALYGLLAEIEALGLDLLEVRQLPLGRRSNVVQGDRDQTSRRQISEPPAPGRADT